MATPTTWKRRVAQWKASGLTAAEFAADRGYAPATLKWWSSRLNTGSVREEAHAPSDRPALTLPLARLVVRREGSSSAGESATETPITLEVGAVRLAVRRGFDAEVLRQLLAVLGVAAHSP
ncbi:hypothetical protein L6V77_15260 [Myxococcota bacterium]|nr:hypothetical protein [Myxococcota bacterium]